MFNREQALASMQNALLSLHNSSDRGTRWLLGGSSSLLAQGVELERAPQDIDLYADQIDAVVLQRCWGAYATDQPEWSVTAMYSSLLSHYLVEGCAVELVGDFIVKQDWCCYSTAIHGALWKQCGWLRLQGEGLSIPLTPLAHELVFNLLRSREDRVEAIASTMEMSPDQHVQAMRAVITRCEPKEQVSILLMKIIPKTMALL